MKPIERLDLDERRTVHRLLERLEPEIRLRWLMWCCAQCSHGNFQVHIGVNTGTAREVYFDWQSACHSLGLDVVKSRAKLEEMVTMFGRPLLFGVEALCH
jgi:hypothetical protein